MKKYYGFVYLWYDTRHKKFLIGSHHGSIKDNYTTSTGGIHIRNIFKSRPQTMRRRIIEYNTEKDDRLFTILLEQKWLDLRPDIANNTRYYNKTNQAGGGFDREIQLKRVRNGTHHFLGGVIQRASNEKRVKNGTHNFQDREAAQQKALARVRNKTHHFLKSDFNKKAFKLYINGIYLQQFSSKVEAVEKGIRAHIIDKLRKYKKYIVERGSYKNNILKVSIGDVFTYEEVND